jgi:hypothetical protein
MTLSMRTLRLASVAILAGLLCASLAEARGGGGGSRGGGRGTGRGMGGGARGGGYGRGVGTGFGRYGPKNDNSEEAMKELEDRNALIADRRKRLADSDREINQEARLAAGRLETALLRSGEDVR